MTIAFYCVLVSSFANNQNFIKLLTISRFRIFLRLLHTGSFAQNSFQIDSINSCCTWKKLEFWLKNVKINYFLTLKPIKGTLGFILEIMKKIARWRHKSEISKRNLKNGFLEIGASNLEGPFIYREDSSNFLHNFQTKDQFPLYWF